MISRIKKIQEVSSTKIKKYFIFLLIMMVLVMIFEMIGLSLIFPLVKQISSSEPNYILRKLSDLNFITLDFKNYSSYELNIFTFIQ